MAGGERPGLDLAGDWAPLQHLRPDVFLAARESGAAESPVPPRQVLNEARAASAALLLARVRELLELLAGRPELAAEVAAEWALFYATDNQLDRAQEIVEPLLATELPPIARARALEALGRLLLWRGDGASAAAGAAALESARELYDSLGLREWAGYASVWLGPSFYLHRGRLAEAEMAIRAGLGRMPADGPRRSVALDWLADLLTRAGRLEEVDAILGESAELADPAERRAQAYLAWSRARLSAARRDAEATAVWLAAVLDQRGEWFDGTSGPTFLADAAVLSERVGRHAAAEDFLSQATARDATDEFVVMARAELLARRGDPEDALRELRRLSTQPWLEAAEVWRQLLLEAWAAFRAGRGDVGATAARAFARADALGSAVAAVGEPELSRALAPAAAAAGSTPAITLLSPRTGVLVRVLGPPAIHRHGEAVSLRPEGASTLVRLLAVTPGGLEVAAAAALLWPGSPTAPRQLRHRLARLTDAAGELVVREGSRLSLLDAWVDATAFSAAAERARRSGDEQDVRLALALWTGDPLPADLYAPWAADVREELRHQRLQLLDLGATLAAARGSTTEAVALLEDGAEADPYEIGRLERAAELLEAAGQAGAAARRRAQAARRLADLA